MKKVLTVLSFVLILSYPIKVFSLSNNDDVNLYFTINDSGMIFHYNGTSITLNKIDGFVLSVNSHYLKMRPVFQTENQGYIELKDYLGNIERIDFYRDNSGNIVYNKNTIEDFAYNYWLSLTNNEKESIRLAKSMLKPLANNAKNDYKNEITCAAAMIATITEFVECGTGCIACCIKGVAGLAIEWEACK